MAVDNLHEKLSKVVSKEPSQWLADAKFRRANKAWLKRSQKVALLILTRLDELKMSQVDLAKKLVITPQQVNKWVKGKENFTFETIEKLERALDFQLMDICTHNQIDTPIIKSPINIILQASILVQKHSTYPTKKEITHKIEKTDNLSSFSRSKTISLC